MTQISPELRKFARQATERFNKEPKLFTYGDLKPDTYFAMRWGLGDDCVIIFKLSFEEPIIYTKVLTTCAIDDPKRINRIIDQTVKEYRCDGRMLQMIGPHIDAIIKSIKERLQNE